MKSASIADQGINCDLVNHNVTEKIETLWKKIETIFLDTNIQRQYYLSGRGVDPLLFIRALKIQSERCNLYSYRSIRTGQYQSYFSIIQSEIPKMQATGSHIVILDGTADLSIDYKQDGIYTCAEVCKPYIRELRNLTIILVECETTKCKLQKRDSKLLDLFMQYIRNDSKSTSICCFSYKDLIKIDADEDRKADSEESKATTKKKENITNETQNEKDVKEYFGNIKGRNDLQIYDVFGQVGINLCPESYYLSRFIDQHKEKRLNLIKGNNSKEQIEWILTDKEYKKAKCDDLLAEIEQNIFRSKIRDDDCCEKIRYYVFYEFSKNKELQTAIVDRFEKHYHAHVELSGDASHILDLGKIMSRKSAKGSNTIAQRLIIESDKIKSGTVFKISEWLETTATKNDKAITKRQFNSAKEKNDVIKKRFNDWCINEHDGIYKKP